VAESFEADVSVDEGVDALVCALLVAGTSLSMESWGLEGRWRVGAVAGRSYALEKVLRTVGDTALRVSRRRLAPLPRMRGCSVLMESLGRGGAWRGGIIGSEVVILDMADDCGCDGCRVDSIMCMCVYGGERVPRCRLDGR
jgi:hypothetical protein